ncbi:hypothetical protein [Methylobacterium oryzae]|uniref:hypothetical protein n=1 Tax=Methylobacterium oryzae TaxID=334852 RepID=UPI002F32AE6E
MPDQTLSQFIAELIPKGVLLKSDTQIANLRRIVMRIAATIDSMATTAAIDGLTQTVSALQGNVQSQGMALLDAQARLTALESAIAGKAATPVPSKASRPLNTPFKLSDTRPTLVVYALQANLSALVLAGQSVTATLEYADASDMANPTTIEPLTNSISGVLNMATANGILLAGLVPAGKYARIKTSGTNGATATYVGGQEMAF